MHYRRKLNSLNFLIEVAIKLDIAIFIVRLDFIKNISIIIVKSQELIEDLTIFTESC